MSAALTRSEAISALAFLAEAGVDCALDEAAHDRFADSAAQSTARETASARPLPSLRDEPRAQPAPRPVETRPAAAASLHADEAALSARALASSAQSLEELRAILEAFDGCSLKATARHCCFADGNPAARVMLVGEAPGADEDRVGLPFVGKSGQLLDRILAAIGLDRASGVYIANTVPWRPPGNRTPTTQEMAICLPFIQRQIELAAPDFLICLGGPSAQSLLGIKDGILKSRGRWQEYQAGARSIPAMATLHPAYLLRQPLQKRAVWRDFRALKARLEGCE
ncbi:MAG: uracil-DNA glycosylase [Bosea sp. (in: a-proteobacteria)]